MPDIKDAASGVKDKATDAATGNLRDQVTGAFTGAARDIIGPAVAQMSNQAAEQAVAFAKEQGPKLVREQVLPQMMKSVGVTDPGDLAKAGIGKAGELLSGGGGLGGLAGKVLKKLGGGKGKGGATATGYGQKRRIMLQQDQHVPVNVKDAYRAWTQSEWTEFMHRVATLDRQIEEDSARYTIGVKGLFFKKSYTAEVREQAPFDYIVWNTTQGNIKNTGRVSFAALSDNLTLMVLNLDMAPSGLREKMVRGFRFHKRGVRGDFHRFSAWVQHRSQDELDELEGWLGTIKGGQITQTHEEYVDAHEEEQERAAKRAEREQAEGEQEEGADDETDEDEANDETDEDEANDETEADAQDEDEDEAEGGDEGDDEGDSEEAGDDDEPQDEAASDEADDEADDEDEDAEATVWEDDEDDDYDDLDVAGLRSELRARDLPSRGSRQALIDRLREDDQ
jgi:uncharacterized membrane protein